MKIAPYDENAYKMDHPRGTVAFNYLLMGNPDKPLENYRYILGRQEGDFHMPRHGHTFEQIRLPVVGDMNLGEQGILHEGEVGYFPEGGTYGPQDDRLTEPHQLQLVLQFAGASGLGMSAGRGRGPANKEAQAERRRPREVTFPRPRYNDVIITNPAHLNFLPVAGWPGVESKHVGTYTERKFWIEFVRIEAGAEWVQTDEAARQLTVVLSGTGTVEGTGIGRLGAVEVDPGEKAHYTATEDLVLYNVGLPPIVLPAVPSDQFDTVISDGGIRFEKQSEADNV
jgi:hypothetical protein